MMTDLKFSRIKTWKYLIWTFALAWLMQAGVAILYYAGYGMIGKLLMAIMMFVPLIGVLLAGVKIKNMGWRPQIKKDIKIVFAVWFLPTLLTVVGAMMYFFIFPGHFDLSGAYLISNAGEEALKQIEAQGLTYSQYVLISIISCLTYAPIFNMFLAVGEEVGWRGFLYPQLKAKYGRGKGVILGGVIWGIWHWPVIWLIGYEYGIDYVGFPVIGMILFCVFTIAMGIFCDWAYERSKCIWIPSLCHGAINAVATIPPAICVVNTGSMSLLGPAPNGLLSGLPLVVLGVILFLKYYRGKKL